MGNWEPVIPYVYRRGALIELDSDDCACILWVNLDPNVDYICDDCPPPTGISKYVATTTAGRTVSAACDSSYVIHEGEIRNKSISSITIGNCVTSLDTYALKSYDNLVTATIPSNVSYIGWGVFNNCDNLVTVNLNASIDRIPVNAFSYCPNLQNITIPGSVIIIDDSSFLWCVSLPSITIPDSVRIIGNGAFDLCSGLTSVTIGNSVTNIGEHAFGNCSGLTSVVIPNSTKYIGDNAFVGCSGLTNLIFGNSVEFIGTGAFADCTSLTGSITLPSTLQHLGCGVFNNCSGLTSVTVEAVVPPEMQHYPPAFENTNDCPIYVPCNSVDAYKHADGWYFYSSRIEAIPGSCVTPKWIATYTGGTTSSAECDASSAITENEITLTDLVSCEIGNCVTSIGNRSFYLCTSLSAVTIPDTVTSIGYQSFGFCTRLTSVNIPSGVTSIGINAFYNCTQLTSVIIPSGVTRINDNTFYHCTSLTSVTIPNTVTRIDEDAFIDCSSLTSITIPSSVTRIGYAAFYNCSGLTSITVEATTPPTLGGYTFDNTNNCPIYVPCGSVSAYQSASGWSEYASRIRAIPGSCASSTKWFATYSGGTTSSAACDSATTIYEGDITLTDLVSVEIGDCITSINNWVFDSCSSLTSVTLPDSVTSFGNNVFYYCTMLPNITIPSGVTYIGRECFYRCSRLQSVTVLATTPPSISTDVFYNTNNCPIYVPSGSVDAYKTANRWSDYASRIQAIP